MLCNNFNLWRFLFLKKKWHQRNPFNLNQKGLRIIIKKNFPYRKKMLMSGKMLRRLTARSKRNPRRLNWEPNKQDNERKSISNVYKKKSIPLKNNFAHTNKILDFNARPYSHKILLLLTWTTTKLKNKIYLHKIISKKNPEKTQPLTLSIKL